MEKIKFYQRTARAVIENYRKYFIDIFLNYSNECHKIF